MSVSESGTILALAERAGVTVMPRRSHDDGPSTRLFVVNGPTFNVSSFWDEDHERHIRLVLERFIESGSFRGSV